MDKLPGICQMQNGLSLSLSFISPSCKEGDDEAGLTGKRASITVLVRVDLSSQPDRIWACLEVLSGSIVEGAQSSLRVGSAFQEPSYKDT